MQLIILGLVVFVSILIVTVLAEIASDSMYKDEYRIYEDEEDNQSP